MKMQPGSVNKIFTKKDIKELIRMATKDLVTKDEFRILRHEFEDFKTRAFETFATKKDLENFSNRAFETFATKEDLKELEERLPSRKQVEEMYSLLDGVAKDMKHIKQEFTFINYRVERLEKRVEKIETHLALES